MANVAYYRVSTKQQTIENQRLEIKSAYNVDHEFFDESTSGSVKTSSRQGFHEMEQFIRNGDNLIVADLDRLGRSALDVQESISRFQKKGVNIIVTRLGIDLSTDVGSLVATILSKIAELERSKILERANSGRARAKAQGAVFGRPKVAEPSEVKQLRGQGLSIHDVAKKLSISPATVKRYQKL
ncbi:multiple promoter invertase [Marinobacter vulgaris]|uniref:Multiple promoter invertase n=1 Tax=Marinobacter vulgaris TaxID=1928331 RepID=A0A2V3ZMS6_9GAMM|nr:recombinase family protein [Marinobacter vulgaris]PXX92243.1 multiple promoter invertase [Marinobacter vulgaris]TSJ71814.1 recombinase family protein [Marinobacter vulgaris]